MVTVQIPRVTDEEDDDKAKRRRIGHQKAAVTQSAGALFPFTPYIPPVHKNLSVTTRQYFKKNSHFPRGICILK